MANTFTANYNLTKPEVGAATNTWGGLLNANFDTIDTQIKARDTQAANAQATANAALPKAGGTMDGFITLHANPTSNFHAATKQYVDGFLLKAGGVMTGYITLHAAPTEIMHPANKKYVDDAVAQAQIQAGAGLPLTGGTMQGFITLSGAPTSSLHAATKAYVDAGDSSLNTLISSRVSKAGDAMTGPLLLSADPTSQSDGKQAATKAYVENRVLRTGDTLTGALTLQSAAPTQDYHAVPKIYVDSNFLSLAKNQTQIMTGPLQLSGNATASLQPVTLQQMQEFAFSKTQTASQLMNGPLLLFADPTNLSDARQAATRNYVDTAAVPRAGTGTSPMTGPLSLFGAPTQGNHAATKDYVDAANYLDQDLKNIAGLSGTGFLKRDAGGSWSLDTSAGSQTITLSGDATGSGTSSIAVSLANSGVTAGSYNSATVIHQLTVDAKGRITAVGSAQTIAPTWSSIASKPTTLSGFGITDGLSTTSAASTYIARSSGTFSGSLTGGSTITLNSTSGAISCSTLTASGDITAFSDARIKDDVRSISDALDLINRLRGVSYIRKDTGKAGVGVIAQEVENVIPAVVTTHDDGMKSVAYGNIVGILIEAVKELAQRVEELEAR